MAKRITYHGPKERRTLDRKNKLLKKQLITDILLKEISKQNFNYQRFAFDYTTSCFSLTTSLLLRKIIYFYKIAVGVKKRIHLNFK